VAGAVPWAAIARSRRYCRVTLSSLRIRSDTDGACRG
jgi:hypothetical protein